MRVAILLLGASIGAWAAQTQTLTGCVDERPNSQFVLREGRELKTIAELEPHGFKNTNFSRFVGNKVAVTGTLSNEDGRQVLQVRSLRNIRRISATCGTGRAERSVQPAAQGRRQAFSTARTATGCLDERPGPNYVLLNPGDMQLLMTLEPKGFPVESFARHVGHRVELRGRTVSAGETPQFQVTSIRDLAESCAPPGPRP